jgi:transcriptional regulator with XRE-family HTH domain
MKHISRRILNEMDRRGIKQTKLGDLAGVSQSTVNRILNTTIDPRVGTLAKIANVLCVPVEYLTIEDETKANLCLEVSRMGKDDVHQTLLHIEKEKLYKESKKAS